MSLRRCALVLALGWVLAPVAWAQADPPWLGLLRPRQGAFGVQVVEVFEDSGAAAAGLLPGDEILEVDGTPVGSVAELVALVQRRAVGDWVTVQALRRDAEMTVVVQLGARVDDRELLHRRLVGKRAPAARLQRVDNERWLDPSALRGKVAVLAWFSTRCDECSAIIGKLAGWSDGRRDAELIAVTASEPALLATYLARNPIALPIAVASEEDAEQYGLLGPAADGAVAFVVIDRDGVVRTAAVVGRSPGEAAATVEDVIASARHLVRGPRR